MPLLVIAYPILAPKDIHRIEEYRKNHDPLYPVVKPHFTFIFPCERTLSDFIDHVERKLGDAGPISFSLDKASVHDDFRKENSYVFLVPDNGFAEMTALYDCLNVGLSGVREAIPGPFLPHITIARSADRNVMEEIAGRWNSNPGIISGKLEFLEIIRYESQIVTSIKKIRLPSN